MPFFFFLDFFFSSRPLPARGVRGDFPGGAFPEGGLGLLDEDRPGIFGVTPDVIFFSPSLDAMDNPLTLCCKIASMLEGSFLSSCVMLTVWQRTALKAEKLSQHLSNQLFT